MMQMEEERNMSIRKEIKETLWELYDSIRKSSIRIIGIPEGEERKTRTESLFKQIVDENFPNLWKEIDPSNQEANRTPNYLNPKRPSPRHIALTVKKWWQRKYLKAARRKKKVICRGKTTMLSLNFSAEFLQNQRE